MERTRRSLFANFASFSGAVLLSAEVTPTPTPTPTPPVEATATPTPPAPTPDPELETPAPAPRTASPPVTRIQIETMVRKQASQAGLNPDRMTRLVACESTFDPGAVSENRLYHGLLQYDRRTWGEAVTEYQRVNHLSDEELAALNLDIYNPVHHIEVSTSFIKRVGVSRWPNC